MKSKLSLLFFFGLSYLGFAQTTIRPIKKLPSKSISALQVVTTDCFRFSPKKGNHYLGPKGNKVRGDHYQRIVQNETINIRTGQRGQSTNYYINGIRVEQDYTPEEMLEEVHLHFNDTPAAFEGNRWPVLLIY